MEEDNVIDNKNVILKDELVEIFPKSESADIAVGYFFISGFSAVADSIQHVPKIRLLISNVTDRYTTEAFIEIFHNLEETKLEYRNRTYVNDKRKHKVLSDIKQNIKTSVEHMSQTYDERRTIQTMLDMIKSEQLEVRVYQKEKLHAKAYIFRLKDSPDGMGIVGSSNLSIAGITHNSELNLKTKDQHDVQLLYKWFENLWQNASEYTNALGSMLEMSWAGMVYSPRDLFLKALHYEMGDRIEGKHKIDPILKKTFPNLYPFQENAVDSGLAIFEQYGGVIIGDVVGLGKTYIGITLLKYLYQQGYKPLIVCPPQLQSMWKKFCKKYQVPARILSRGKLSQKDYDLNQDFEFKDKDIVLIDESHHFRNSGTRQYKNLAEFMDTQNAKAILLTATPYANKAEDIKNQVMLFHRFSSTLIPPANETDLDKYFKMVEAEEADLTDLLRNIMIRRTRRYILSQWGKKDDAGRSYIEKNNERKYFPDRKMETSRYNINIVYQGKYQSILERLSKDQLTFAQYNLGQFVKPEYKHKKPYSELGSGIELVALMRHILLKRMESSIAAFKASIDRFIKRHEESIKIFHQGKVPIGDISSIEVYQGAIDDIESLDDTVDKSDKYSIDAFDVDKAIKFIKNDLDTFKDIQSELKKIDERTDDKLITLQRLLENEYAGKKILLFTEFTDTGKYLRDHIKWKGNMERVDSQTGNIIECARRFDPENNHADDEIYPSQQLTLLISTDVLSEGVNLQAGQVVINYDFHWNPTRLIQRAGRVDRIGSQNEYVNVHNFLPDPEMDQNLHLESRVKQKIKEIQEFIGEDYKILTKDEIISQKDMYAIYGGSKAQKDEILDREATNLVEQPSRFEKIINDVYADSEAWERLKNTPTGIRSSSQKIECKQLLMACESGYDGNPNIKKYYLIGHDRQVRSITSRKALELLESNDEQRYNMPEDYDELISVGWEQFLEEIRQIKASHASPKHTQLQNWVINELTQYATQKEFSSQKDVIEQLIESLSGSISKSLVGSLSEVKKEGTEGMALINKLEDLYNRYSLSSRQKDTEKTFLAPRIIYSRYINGD